MRSGVKKKNKKNKIIFHQKKIHYSFSPMATVQNKSLSIFQLHLFPICDTRQQEFDAPFQSRDSLEMVRMLKAQIYFLLFSNPNDMQLE